MFIEQRSGASPQLVHVLVLVLVLVHGLIAGATPLLAAQLSGPVVTTLTIFAGTETGLWRSADWGYRWERVEGAGSHLEHAEPDRGVRSRAG